MYIYKSLISGNILNQNEFNELIKREYKEMWEDEYNLMVLDYKEQGFTFEEFLQEMIEKDDSKYLDFEIIEID